MKKFIHKKTMPNRKCIDIFCNVWPPLCSPVIVTDAGFRAAWFKLVDKLNWGSIGRIRNRDMVRQSSGDELWLRCKTLYSKANRHAKDLDAFDSVRSNPVACRLVLPNLAELTASKVVALYSGRMQIEQTFRDLKNPRWGLALSHTQTRCSKRLAVLLIIAALVIYALCHFLSAMLATRIGQTMSANPTSNTVRT